MMWFLIVVFILLSFLLQDQVCKSFHIINGGLFRRVQSFKMVVSTTGSGKRVRPQGYDREKGIANPNLLRVTGGKARGLKLDSPNVYLRPMMAKVREALFSCLGHYELFETNTTRVLDMFSGSGSVGIEALSRGASHTTFVDFAEDCVSTALQNAHKCGFGGQVSAVKGDVLDVLTNPDKYKLTEKYQLITLTPPYEEVVYNHLLDALCSSPLIGENTFVVLEYPVELGTLPFVWGDYQLFGLRNRRYGRTILCVYVYKPTEEFDFRQDEFTEDAVKRKKG